MNPVCPNQRDFLTGLPLRLKSSAAFSESINTPFSPLVIGADTNANALQFFAGAISDVRIYGRT